MFKTTTYQQAKECGEISQEILVYPAQKVFIDKSGITLLESSGGGDISNDFSSIQCPTQSTPIQPNLDKSASTQPTKKISHFTDIFGNFHYFFRPYTHTTLECKVRILPDAYCYTNDEIIWTKSKKSLISHTPLRSHPLDSTHIKGRLTKIFSLYKIAKKWLRFYLDILKCKKKQASVALLTREVGNTYGHFIKELLAGFYQLKMANITPDFYILPLNTPFQKQMYGLLGIPQERIIPSNPIMLVQTEKLIVPTLIADYEIIEYRHHLHFRSFFLPPFIYQMFDHLLPKHVQANKKIFLTRPKNSNRNIENLDEVENIFKEFGYEITLPDKLTIQKQIQLFSSSTHIASMHGSGLSNLAFSPKNTRIFEIFPQYYHDPAQCYMALARGCKYSYMVGETHDTSMHPQQENVYVNPEKLKLALQIFEQE